MPTKEDQDAHCDHNNAQYSEDGENAEHEVLCCQKKNTKGNGHGNGDCYHCAPLQTMLKVVELEVGDEKPIFELWRGRLQQVLEPRLHLIVELVHLKVVVGEPLVALVCRRTRGRRRKTHF